MVKPERHLDSRYMLDGILNQEQVLFPESTKQRFTPNSYFQNAFYPKTEQLLINAGPIATSIRGP
jgi:hypothetical protein